MQRMMIYHSKNYEEKNLDKREILERVSPLSIFEKYFGQQIVLGRKYNSPFREDRNPSFVFFEGNSKLKFHDFSTGKSGDCFDFVCSLYNMSFKEALIMLNNDFNLNLKDSQEPVKVKDTTTKKRKEKLIQVKIQKYTKEDLQYWSKFLITEKELKRFNIFSIREVWIDKQLYATYLGEDPIFGYHFPKSDHIKIYRPLTRFKKNKWIGNSNRDDIHGEDQLRYESDSIILTSSLKDIMVLGLLGYEAIALNSEGARPNNRVLDIMGRYKRKYILYDNDSAGENYAEMILKLIPDVIKLKVIDDKSKDPSDFVRENGLEKLKQMLDEQTSRK
jgi:DNA primase